MSNDAQALGDAFERWKQLTDDYEASLDALARQEPGARERVIALSAMLRQFLAHPDRANDLNWPPGDARKPLL